MAEALLRDVRLVVRGLRRSPAFTAVVIATLALGIGVTTVWMNTMLSGYRQEQLVPILQTVEERLHAIPGVRLASSSLYAPMSRLNWHHDVRIAALIPARRATQVDPMVALSSLSSRARRISRGARRGLLAESAEEISQSPPTKSRRVRRGLLAESS